MRAGLVNRPGEWQWSGHGEYLGRDQPKLIDTGPVMAELRSRARYEAFIREGIKESYRAEWHPGDHAPFLGPEKFIKRIAREKTPPPVSRRVSLGELLGKIAVKGGVEPQAVRRKGRAARLVQARDRFICQAVMEQGYRASEVVAFLHCYRPIQAGHCRKIVKLETLGKSDTARFLVCNGTPFLTPLNIFPMDYFLGW